MGEAAAEQEERVDVLRAMLTVAEDELRAKDAQIEYIQQMLAASEQARLASNAAARAHVGAPSHPSIARRSYERGTRRSAG